MESFLTLLTGLVLAFVAAKLALLGSKSEKWWERKAQLYERLIEALYDIHLYNAEWLDAYHESGFDESPAQQKRRKTKDEALLKRNQDAKSEVDKLTLIGTFLISDAVQADLLAFKKAEQEGWRIINGPEQDTYSGVDHMSAAAKTCLQNVREHAKEDLGLKGWLAPSVKRVRSFLDDQFNS